MDENNLLHYKENEEDPAPINHIALVKAVEAGSVVKTMPEIDPAAFCIEVPGRAYILKASTQESMIKWINDLNAALKYIQQQSEGEILQESSQNIAQKVKAGNLAGLVHALTLTHGEAYDKEYIYTFLMTYRSFATGLEVLDEIAYRYKKIYEQVLDIELAKKARYR